MKSETSKFHVSRRNRATTAKKCTKSVHVKSCCFADLKQCELTIRVLVLRITPTGVSLKKLSCEIEIPVSQRYVLFSRSLHEICVQKSEKSSFIITLHVFSRTNVDLQHLTKFRIS